MKLKSILLAAIAAFSFGPPHAGGQEVAHSVSDQIASLASYQNFIPSCTNPCPAEETFCGSGQCGDCTQCCRTMDIFGSAEFLLWWAKGTVTPPLVTTSPDGTPQVDAGVLPDADVLFGQSYLGDEVQAGGRITFGIWLDEERNVGAAGRFYGTGGARDTFRRSSDGSPILARPFFNTLLDQNDALLIAFDDGATDISDGSIEASYSNQNFLGAEAYLQIMMEQNHRRRIDVIAGYQFMRLDDALQIDSTSILRQFGDLELNIRDRFWTNNEFHGANVGLKAQMARGCWSIEALGKIALGVTRQEVNISGRTMVGGGPTVEGGLLAQPSNIGTYQRDTFGYIPELTLNLKYHVTPTLSFHTGYSLIWWSDVVTSGRQIDTGVNLSQPVGDDRPAFAFEDEDYWLQGINFGMNWDF
ncbi:MAG: BBP7 family outer membrane beta-barrel protein [Pirellulaceae bacterium]